LLTWSVYGWRGQLYISVPLSQAIVGILGTGAFAGNTARLDPLDFLFQYFSTELKKTTLRYM